MFESIWKRILRRKGISLWSAPAVVLWVMSLGYRAAVRLRPQRTTGRVRASVPVISVGNITVGGSGKTPLVKLLAQSLIQNGLRVGIISSGYKRSGMEPLVGDGLAISARAAEVTGDEVNMLAHELPHVLFSIHRLKREGVIQLQRRGGVDVMIVDDGFQHFGLHRDLDIVAFDAAVPTRWLKMLPYGILREPLAALSRADLIILTRSDFSPDISALKAKIRARAPRALVYTARFVGGQLIGGKRRLSVKYLEDKSVLLFAGVGHFDSLRRQVQSLSGSLKGALELADHQRYDRPTMARILRLANELGPDIVLTTAKDWVKTGHFDFGREFYYLDLQVDLDPGEEQMTSLIMERLGLTRREN